MEHPPIPPYLSDPPEEEPILKSFHFNSPNRPTMRFQSDTIEDVIIFCEPYRISCAIVESTSITPNPVPLPTKKQNKKRMFKKLPETKWIRRVMQFFESIDPKSEFNTNEDLEEYLYNKSLEIQPKGLETPTSEVKPKHNSSTLRSPGIKPPKPGNHYSANHPLGLHLHSQHSHSAPHGMSHQSNTVPSTPVTAHETKRSLSQNQEESQFAMVDVRYDRKGTHQKIPVLQPPPLLPRSRQFNQPINSVHLPPTTQAPMPPAPKTSTIMSTASSPTSTSTTPSSALGPAPKLHPRRMPQPMSPLAKSPLTPSKDNSSTAFQFPVVYEVAPPPLPPRPSASSDASSPSTSGATKENQEQLRVIFDREESHSPTVRLSVALPPALPPPRGSAVSRAPPPLPPKSNRRNSSSPTSSSDPFDDPTSPSIFVNTPPPPLPPKTYRITKK
ncbi:hypothetical protein GCK72_019404 [Caenorhabditis remanei]|uniref:Uncharacterized protein n=2 Tax=Caenorhabditis remanei TaxID=31234 RepID=A0A6A5GEI3_CAERE|nr:hypothetical protein GCK72_019404 [Caenorhabditis remanei]KAF1752849.1 hypothetical protein GCK72_019404 [Caenorhabditis remanei]